MMNVIYVHDECKGPAWGRACFPQVFHTKGTGLGRANCRPSPEACPFSVDVENLPSSPRLGQCRRGVHQCGLRDNQRRLCAERAGLIHILRIRLSIGERGLRIEQGRLRRDRTGLKLAGGRLRRPRLSESNSR